jgi:hypothetical protein
MLLSCLEEIIITERKITIILGIATEEIIQREKNKHKEISVKG